MRGDPRRVFLPHEPRGRFSCAPGNHEAIEVCVCVSVVGVCIIIYEFAVAGVCDTCTLSVGLSNMRICKR